jgi:hypothetical protein
MNKISYPQLVKDIADAYRNAIGSTDSITIGELANKVGEAISRGNSIRYKSITYNEDNTITLIDNDDIEHTISCLYEDEKIVSIALDSEEIKLSYDGDNLIAAEDTMINLNNMPIPKAVGISIQSGEFQPTVKVALDCNTSYTVELLN